MKRHIVLFTLLLTSCGKDSGAPQLVISDAWARETVAGQTSTAAYMTISNEGPAEDRVVNVSAPPPMRAMLHTSNSSDGISRMRPGHDGLRVGSGDSVALEPGGTHIMITNLVDPLKSGDTLKVTLRFERSGERSVEARVTTGARTPTQL